MKNADKLPIKFSPNYTISSKVMSDLMRINPF